MPITAGHQNRPSAMKVVADDEMTMRSEDEKEAEWVEESVSSKGFDPIKTLKEIFRDNKGSTRAPMSTNYIVNKYK